MSELHELSLTEVCQHMTTGALDAEQVTSHLLARIDLLDHRYRAYASVRRDAALQRARELDLLRRSGATQGPLHGVPIAAKDLLFMAGETTASGTRVMAGYRPTETATVIERLVQAGAVIIGKTQLTEGAFAAHHPSIDPPKNPWNSSRWPGVSSSGSGVAVAARLCFGALGTDTGGSIRFPSASCGVVGFKPTYGRVSRFGAFPLAESLDHIGPMTRTVGDAARMLAVIAGQDPRDPTSSALPVPDLACAYDTSLQGVVLAVDWEYAETGVDPVVSRTVRESVAGLAALGATIRDVVMPAEYRVLVDRWAATCARECAQAHAGFFPARRDEYGPVLASLIDLGLSISASAYAQIEKIRHRFTAELDVVLEGVHALIVPNMVSLAPDVGEMAARTPTRQGVAPFTTFTAPFDYSGHPTLTVPVGLSGGLPTSVQLVGRRFRETDLVRLGLALERSVDALPYARLD